MGFFFILATPTIMSLIQETCPENRALVNSLYMTFSFAFYSIDVLIVGRIADLFDLRVAAFVSVAITVVGLPFIFMLPKKATKQ
jgi:MFS family permease